MARKRVRELQRRRRELAAAMEQVEVKRAALSRAAQLSLVPSEEERDALERARWDFRLAVADLERELRDYLRESLTELQLADLIARYPRAGLAVQVDDDIPF